MSRIFWRISSWYSRMWRSASISCAQRLSMIFTAPLPKMSCWKMSDRLACGSTEKTSTRLPCWASQKAVAAENVVLPRPPLPPNMTYRRSGCARKTPASDPASGAMVGATRVESRVGVAIPTSPCLEHRVREVLLAEHPTLPRGDLGDRVREEPERVVGRKDRDAEHVAHRGEDEEVLHARPRPHGVASHVVGGHAVGDLADMSEPAAEPAGPRGLRRGLGLGWPIGAAWVARGFVRHRMPPGSAAPRRRGGGIRARP